MNPLSGDDPIDIAIQRLASLSGLPLEAVVVRSAGFDGRGARIAGLPAGKSVRIVLTRTLNSAMAVVLPEDAAGPLVRRIGWSAQDDPDRWREAVRRILDSGISLDVSVNGYLLDDPADPPATNWWTFSIECSRRSAARTGEQAADTLVEVGTPALTLALTYLVEDGLEDPAAGYEPLPEGASVTVQVNRYERSPVNRMHCISHYGATCWVCELDFEDKYGAIGAGFIEVHHRIPVSMMGGKYAVDPIKDLVPLCSNCHSMAHRRVPPYQPGELRQIMGMPKREPGLPPLRH